MIEVAQEISQFPHIIIIIDIHIRNGYQSISEHHGRKHNLFTDHIDFMFRVQREKERKSIRTLTGQGEQM